MSETLIRVDHVSKKFCRSLRRSLWYGLQDLGNELRGHRHHAQGELRPEEFWAVRDASFELKRGECLGLIGPNGAGKTTLLRVLSGLIKPDAGRVEIRGQVGALIALGAGFHPLLSGRENIYINGAVLGLSKRDIERKLDDIIDFSGISAFIDAPVQSYSSGMVVRLGFAIASSLEPDVLLIDEVLAVGDAGFKVQCFKRIGELLDRAGVVFVSHDEAQIARICDRCLLLDTGQGTLFDSAGAALKRYRQASLRREGTTLALHRSIEEFRSDPEPLAVAWGGQLAVPFAYTVTAPVEFGQVIVALRQNDASLAQCVLPPDTLSGAVGRHAYELTFGPVHLREGEYDVALYATNASNKATLIQAQDFRRVAVHGPAGLHVSYQIPVSCRAAT